MNPDRSRSRCSYNCQRYLEALEYALRAHEGQFRKGSGIPYITHPVAVSAILAEYGYDEDIVIAALLHDVLEDAEVSEVELEKRFGGRVASIVRGVTEEKTDENGIPREWEIRKEEAIRHTGLAEEPVVALKAADSLHNVYSLVRDLRVTGESLWARFKRGKEKQLDYYRRLSSIIRQRLKDSPLAIELCEAVTILEKVASEYNH